MSITQEALKRSLWVFHLATGVCNNCDIEVLDMLTPRFDVERFGMLLVGSVRHADVLLVTGVVTRKVAPRLLEVYNQAPKPCLVVALGACSLGQGIFKDGYNNPLPVDKYIPVDVYVPGCPPKPEAMILGILKAREKIGK